MFRSTLRVNDKLGDKPGLANLNAILVNYVIELALFLQDLILVVFFIFIVFHILIIVGVDTSLLLLVQVVHSVELLQNILDLPLELLI